MYYLYRITNTFNNKVYIGQSNKETERWRQHKYFARQAEPIQYIHRAMKKYGVEYFVYEVIACCQTQEDTDATETLLIQQYDSRNKEKGYNVAPGGDHAWNAGLPVERQPMYGKRHTEKSKQKISESNIGKEMPPHTQEWKDNMSQKMSGRILTDEWKEKISSSNTGRALSEEWKKKISYSMMGAIPSEECKLKMSQSHLGKPGPRGERSGHAKLTWILVRKIREEFITGDVSKSKLARKYGVSQPAIKDIIMNRTWKE